jgi:hypothetical protein
MLYHDGKLFARAYARFLYLSFSFEFFGLDDPKIPFPTCD